MTAAARVHRHRRLLPYAAALVAAATLGSCSGGDPGPATTTPPVTSTAATTTTAQPPTMTPTPTATVDPVIAKIPAAARKHTQSGSEAFAKYYIEQVNEAFVKGASRPLEGLASPSCKVCAALESSARELQAKRRHHKGLSIEVKSAQANRYDSQVTTVVILIEQHRVPVVDEQGRQVDETSSDTGAFLATMQFNNKWYIERLQVAK